MVLSTDDRDWIQRVALDGGFDLAGIASVPESTSAAASEFAQRYAEWIGAGRAGEMEYLKRVDESGGLVRGDLRRAIPWARSVVVCAINYNAPSRGALRSIDPADSTAGWIARYAWSGRQPLLAASVSDPTPGSDYHDVLLPRLRTIEAQLRERFPAANTRCYVDTGPIVERDFAALAGIGWIGKNTCVLHQQQGSWLLLGVIVTSLQLDEAAWTVPAADRCGTCTRCIDACPTHALTAPRQMDASLCIAYLTIEKKGAIDADLRPLMGRQVFGCDICQDVCPWNAKSAVAATKSAATDHPLPPRSELINPPLDRLASLDGRTFNRWFRGSPLERTGRKRILRNVAIAMGNSAEQKFLTQLQAWSQGEDPVLAEAASWAMERLNASVTHDK